jgi:hypothetical protein
MMQRRDALKGLAGLAGGALLQGAAMAAPSKIRVTLVRWPYT